MVACAFCDVAAGVRPAHMVYADDVTIGFLDHSPLFKGHVLVVPRAHVDQLADLPAHMVGSFFATVQRVAAAMPGALGCDGSFVAINNVVSQSVPHLHAHVIPRRRKDGLRGFFWPRERYIDEGDATDFAERLRAALS